MRHTFLPLGLACLLGMTAVPLTVAAASLTRDSGSIDINQRVQDWKDYGGARLYWLSVAQPRQIRMGGLPFVDPASHPLLVPEEKATTRRASTRRRTSRQSSSAVRTQKAPRDAGSTSLRKPTARSGGTVSSGSVPIEQTSRRRSGGIAVTTEVPRPVAPVSGGPWAPVPGTPPVSGLGMYDAQPVPAIIPAGSLPPGAATGTAMTPPVPAAPAVARPAPAPVPVPAAPVPAGGPADVYSPQTVPGTPLPPLPGSAAAQPMPTLQGTQGTAAMMGVQNGMTARSGG